jgi:hypothetical protein
MDFLLIFFLTTLPAGIAIIYLRLSKKEMNTILLKHDKDYKPKQSIEEFFKIIKLYKRCSSLNKKEVNLETVLICKK